MEKVYSPEIMDDFSIQDNRIDEALNELKIINKYLGGNSVSKKGFSILKKLQGKTKNLTILDIGAGSTDNLITLSNSNRIIAVDKNVRACKYLLNEEFNKQIICSDVFNLPIKNKSVDVVHASLFMHHFKEEELLELLHKVKSISSWFIINDLRRSYLAYLGIKILTSLFSKSKMVKHDGPLSVKRSFTKRELNKIIKQMEPSYFILKRKWAFRWLAVIKF